MIHELETVALNHDIIDYGLKKGDLGAVVHCNLGLSQQDLARKAQITQQQLSNIESGMNCNISTLLKVCHALKVKLNLVMMKAA